MPGALDRLSSSSQHGTVDWPECYPWSKGSYWLQPFTLSPLGLAVCGTASLHSCTALPARSGAPCPPRLHCTPLRPALPYPARSDVMRDRVWANRNRAVLCSPCAESPPTNRAVSVSPALRLLSPLPGINRIQPGPPCPARISFSDPSSTSAVQPLACVELTLSCPHGSPLPPTAVTCPARQTA